MEGVSQWQTELYESVMHMCQVRKGMTEDLPHINGVSDGMLPYVICIINFNVI
jgi:hypothetical protein